MKRLSTSGCCSACLVLALLAPLLFSQSPPANPDKTVVFETAVLPVFQTSCVPCHGTAVKMKELDLSTFAGVIKGGDDGPVITPGKPQESRLYEMVEKGMMPKGG